MHYLMTPIGSGGDVQPFVTIGQRLVRRGHEVTLFAAEPFQRSAEAAGLAFVSTWPAEDYEREVLNPALWHPTDGPRLVMDILTSHLDEAWEQLASRYDPATSVFVAHTLSFATLAFAEKHRAPSAAMHLSPNVFRSKFEQPVVPSGQDLNILPRFLREPVWRLLDRFLIDPMIAPQLNDFRARRDLPPVRRVFHHAVHKADRVLALFPDWFAAPQPDWPAHTVVAGFPIAPEAEESVDPVLEEWLADGDPPLVFTPGTANRQARDFFRVAIEAAERLGRRSLLLTRWREQLPAALPPASRHFEFAPLRSMLHRCAAFVHHGGIGSCAQGLQSGVPQLVMPMAFDQPDNAKRLRKLGVADSITPARFTAATVSASLRELLASSAVREACERWKRELAKSSGVDRACDALESLASA